MAGGASSVVVAAAEPLVMYIVVRGDLAKAPFKWPLGTLISQGAHAATAVMWRFRDDANTVKYAEDLERMHKVVLEAPSLEHLETVSADLTTAGLDHHRWIELPEGVFTALATKPYLKSAFENTSLRKLKLFR